MQSAPTAEAFDPTLHASVDAMLEPWRSALAADAAGYGGHAHRVLAYALTLAPSADQNVLAVAAAFHDLGIWSAGTFDYLDPSEQLALRHLDANGQAALGATAGRMIQLHHRLRPVRDGADAAAVEAFRRADLVDVAWGMLRLGVPSSVLRESRRRWPNAGFHSCLVRVGTAWACRHPLRPLPMLRF